MLRALWVVGMWLLMIGVFSVQAQLPLYDLPDPVTYAVQISSSATMTRGGRIIVSNALANRVSIINLQNSLDAELEIGADPQGVAIVPDNLRALAVSRADSRLAIIDLETNQISALYAIDGKPYGIVSTEDTAYISLQDRAEVIAVRLQDGHVLERIPTPPYPTALALWGDFLYVTHFWSGAFSLIYLPSGEVVRTIQPAAQAGLSASIEIDPAAGLAYLPQTIVNDGAGVTLANQHIPVVQVIDLSTLQVQRTINLVVADRPVSMPFAARLPANRARLYVASAGSDAVTVINLQTDTADAHVATGSAPQAILFNRDSTRIYVHDGISGTLTVLDTRFFGLEDQIPTASASPDPVYQLGARLFHSALDARLSQTGMTACASCHFDRGADGRQWYGTATLPALQPENIQSQWLLEHLSQMQGGTGFAADSLDMQALIRYLRD